MQTTMITTDVRVPMATQAKIMITYVDKPVDGGTVGLPTRQNSELCSTLAK